MKKNRHEQTIEEIKKRLRWNRLDPGEVDQILCEMLRDGWDVSHELISNVLQSMPRPKPREGR